MFQPKLTLIEKIKESIGTIAMRVWLWTRGQTESELLADLYENAIHEYKSEKANNWMSK